MLYVNRRKLFAEAWPIVTRSLRMVSMANPLRAVGTTRAKPRFQVRTIASSVTELYVQSRGATTSAICAVTAMSQYLASTEHT